MEELPPGFRFYPTEEELVSFYLLNKLEGKRQEIDRVIKIVDIYNIEPWNLPRTHLFSFAFCCIVSAEFSGELCHGDTEQWFFFTPRQEREARGGRPNRTTASGYWKATGSPGYVYSSDNRVIGVKKTMVFYKGKAPTGRKTQCPVQLRHEFSLCRVYVVSGSFRAFDRRPLEVTSETQHQGDTAVTSSQNTAMETQHQGGTAVTSSQNTAMVQKTSSPETSYSGGDRADPREAGGSTDWDMNDDLEQPLWEWEQLNWP